MRPETILLVNEHFRVRGGTDRVFLETMDLLQRRGHRVVPFSTADPLNVPSEHSSFFVERLDYEKLSQAGTFTKARFLARAIYNLEARRKISSLLKAAQPQMAHVHNVHYQLSPSVFQALKNENIPIVMTLHSYRLICPNGYLYTKGTICQRCKGKRFYNPVLQRCIRGSLPASCVGAMAAYIHWAFNLYSAIDLFIAPSSFMRDKLTEFGFQEERIRLLPNFLDLAKFQPQYEDGSYIVWFGRLVEQKGIFTLLKAMKGLPSVRLFIVGEGPAGGELERLSAKERMENVTFTGGLADERLLPALANARFIVVPSEWYENSPMAIYEAFALGKPVIASKIGGIPELVEHGKNGLLFEPGDVDALTDAIEHLWRNPALCRKMGQEAHQTVEDTFSAERHYEQLMSVYEEALSTKLSTEEDY